MSPSSQKSLLVSFSQKQVKLSQAGSDHRPLIRSGVSPAAAGLGWSGEAGRHQERGSLSVAGTALPAAGLRQPASSPLRSADVFTPTAAAAAPGAAFASCFPTGATEGPSQGCITRSVVCKCKNGLESLVVSGLSEGTGPGGFRTSLLLENRLGTAVTLSSFIRINREGLCPRRPSRSFSRAWWVKHDHEHLPGQRNNSSSPSCLSATLIKK